MAIHDPAQRLCKQTSGAITLVHFLAPLLTRRAHIILEPLDFIARLAALVPKPRVNLTRFHGVFAPNSTLRALVTPGQRRGDARIDAGETANQRRAAMTWAQRLKRVFRIDIETCRLCGGTLKIGVPRLR